MTVPGNLSSPLLATAADAAAAAANITKSLRFNSGDSTYLNRTPSSAGNQKTFTCSFWVKRCDSGVERVLLNAQNGSNLYTRIRYRNTNLFEFYAKIGSTNYYFQVPGLQRDHSAWAHYVVAVDTTLSTAADRLKIYRNGADANRTTITQELPQNADLAINSTLQHSIGADYGNDVFDGYLADIYLIDGSALDASSFGAYDDNGVWQAAAYSGTFGTNGFHLLDFANESTVGHDSSGNENDFTANNISTSGSGTDILLDVPVNGDASDDTGAGGELSANYATLNVLNKHGSSDVISNGNLESTMAGGSAGLQPSTIAFSSGKFYYEVVYSGQGDVGVVGIRRSDSRNFDNSFLYHGNGNKLTNAGSATSYGANYGNNEVIGVAVDMDNGTLTFYKNGASQGQAFTGISGEYTFVQGKFSGSGGAYKVNYGQRSFSYSAPSGFKCLCTSNLPTPTIADGSDYFQAKTYDGNGSTQTITGLEFSPDLVWLKRRNGGAHHHLYDTVRGATERLQSSTTNAESTNSSGVTAFTSDGWTMGSDSNINGSSNTYVAWTWDAGSSTVSNTNGSITSSVRANQTAGFSIVSFTGNGTAGATIGHGLSAAPEMVWYKNRDRSENWGIYAKVVGASKSLYSPSTTSALTANSGSANMYNSTDPSATVLTVGQAPHVNASGEDIIAYCFTSVEGYSKVFEWIGNGSADGTFVPLSFRPAFILYKAHTQSEHWHIRDTARESVNDTRNRLLPSSSLAENGDADFSIDMLSNGIKLRASNATQNSQNHEYLFYAVAENPFQANGGLAR